MTHFIYRKLDEQYEVLDVVDLSQCTSVQRRQLIDELAELGLYLQKSPSVLFGYDADLLQEHLNAQPKLFRGPYCS